jgi:hypothetical protein
VPTEPHAPKTRHDNAPLDVRPRTIESDLIPVYRISPEERAIRLPPHASQHSPNACSVADRIAIVVAVRPEIRREIEMWRANESARQIWISILPIEFNSR